MIFKGGPVDCFQARQNRQENFREQVYFSRPSMSSNTVRARLAFP